MQHSATYDATDIVAERCSMSAFMGSYSMHFMFKKYIYNQGLSFTYTELKIFIHCSISLAH